MPVPILSDGTPLTFEWLNTVANAINSLEADNKNNSNILVSGYIKDVDVLVVTGTKSISVPATKAGSIHKINNIKFPVAFKDNEVVVVAMVTSIPKNGNNSPKPAGVAVGGITKSNFDAVIQLFDDEAAIKNKSFELKYIAIGKRSIV